MKLNAHHDIVAPIEGVFDALSDTLKWEKASLRRGMLVKRRDGGTGLSDGSEWDIHVTVRGKPRDFTLTAKEITRPNQIIFDGGSNMFTALITVDLIELSARKTRASLSVETTPKTLAARIMLQSAKLAKSALQKRFAQRVRRAFAELEEQISRNF
jgi:hypothetical protein